MTFHFTEEDFKRYVTVDEHGGRHIWHELQDRLKHEFGSSFSSTPYIARGDRLRTIWFAPTGTPRHKWDNQAQFFLARSIEERQLTYGLMVECPTLSDVAEYGYDEDRDGMRLVELLEYGDHFSQRLNDLVRNQNFAFEVNVWDKDTRSPSDAAELLTVLKSLPPEQGWGTHIQQVLNASEAIAGGEIIADQIMDAYRATRPLFEAVVPDSVRDYLAHPIASLPQNEELEEPANHVNRLTAISAHFAAHGLHFTPHQLATFYTALKIKGFVILTGISGTGKTKLAQYFAELLGSKDQFHFAAVRPDWRDSKSLLGYFNPLLGEEGQFQFTEFLQFLLQAEDNYRSSLHELKWEADGPYAGTLLAEPDAFGTDTVKLTLKGVNASGQVVAEETFEFKVNERRQLALRGRIDDLQPFRNAAKIRALELDRVFPYFVLLDEMNLAKVEYYFADFLSVLESGRREDGFTKEAIRFQYPEGIDGPPRQLYLPSNLYFIGTVNVDETTYMFSPKVLDWAFTFELSEVDFTAYPSERGDGLSQEELEALRARLLPDFTNQGRFAIVDKNAVADFVRQYPTHREHLTELNALLQPYSLHFGYRVFDEIMMFLISAEGSPVFDGFGPDGLDAAFDAAVLMKVLPKFHGTRGKLREPLEKMVWWAREPDNPEAGRQALSDKLQNTEGIASLREDLHTRIEGGTTEERADANAFAYPRTALKSLRMLHDLHTTGFASFA